MGVAGGGAGGLGGVDRGSGRGVGAGRGVDLGRAEILHALQQPVERQANGLQRVGGAAVAAGGDVAQARQNLGEFGRIDARSAGLRRGVAHG
ncbi:hypothetical protein ACFQ4O_17095, partial [Methylopila musalis]